MLKSVDRPAWGAGVHKDVRVQIPSAALSLGGRTRPAMKAGWPQGRGGSSPLPPTKTRRSDFSEAIFWAAQSAAHWFCGSPRTARLAKKRFEILCDFYLFCPKKNFCYNRDATNQTEKPFLVAVSESIKVSLGWSHRGGHLSFNNLIKKYYAKILFIRPQIHRHWG